MKKWLTRIIGGLALLIALPFIAGFMMALLGLDRYEPDEASTEPAALETSTPAVAEAEILEQVESVSQEVDSTEPEIERIATADLPELSADAVADWLLQNRWLQIDQNANLIGYDKARFAGLTADQAEALYQALAEDDSDVYEFIRQRFFAFAAWMPQQQRDQFAQRVGAVIPPSMWFADRVYFGDFTWLFWLSENEPMFQQPMVLYAAVLEDNEMVRALEQYGALLINQDYDGGWSIRVQNKLTHLQPDTLMAIHDAIDDRLLGHRRYLRAELREMAGQ